MRNRGRQASRVESIEVVGHLSRRAHGSRFGKIGMVDVQVAILSLRLSCGHAVRRVGGRDVTDEPGMAFYPLQSNGRRYAHPPKHAYCEVCAGGGPVPVKARRTSPRRARGLWSPGVGEAATVLLEARARRGPRGEVWR